MPNELLPSNIQFGTVVGRFGSAPLIAGDADGLPDFSPASGLTVTFTPSTAAVIDATATPAPVTIEMVPIVCGLDSQGYLVGGDGQRGVKLIATDDTDINPSGWTYSVTFLRGGQKVAAFRDFSMSLPAGTVKDIALTIPVPSSSGVSLNQAQAAEAAAVAAASAASAAAAAAAASAATFVPATVDTLGQATTFSKALVKTSDATAARTTLAAVGKGDLVVDATDAVAGTGDRTSALQSFLNARSDGEEVLLPAGNLRVDGPVTISKNGLRVRLRPNTVWNRAAGAAATDSIVVAGSDVTITGGTITSPSTWNGANVTPTYAVIRATAPGFTADGITLVNVPKVGIYCEDTDDMIVRNCKITGNYPAASWTGVETAHFGIAVNPSANATTGRTIISGNLIRSCVQGVFLGNYGAGITGIGATITGNIIDGCHNHGVYQSLGWQGTNITGNSFTRCALPIAVTGTGHVVSSNVLTTLGTGDNLDAVGISVRDANGCAVTGNTVMGDAPIGAVIIDLANYTIGTSVSRNTVTGNTIAVTGGTSVGIRVGRPPQTTTCSDNIVAGNVIRSVGTANLGLIQLGTAGTGTGNKVTGNQITVLGEAHGIKLDLLAHSTVQNNTVRFEFDAASAKTVGGIVLNTAQFCTVSGNDLSCPATFGTNVSIRGVWEQTAAGRNRIIGNTYDGDLTKLTAFTPIWLFTNSDVFIDDSGVGAPTFYGVQGSRWARTDGGLGTSLYVKETANTSTTWTAVAGIGSIPAGIQSAPGLAIGGETNTGFYLITAGSWQYVSAGALVLRMDSTGMRLTDGKDLFVGSTTGSKIATGATAKLGFWGKAPVVQPAAPPADATDLTTALALVNDLKAKLKSIGIVA